MKPKDVLSLALVSALAPLLTGCLCSYAVSQKAAQRTVNTFNPAALYQTTNHGAFALEGTRHNHDQTQAHAFVIIPKELLARPQTNESISLVEIKEMASRIDATQLDKTSKLSSSYEKIGDFPKNDLALEIDAHHPEAAWAMLLPFALVVDAVGFPFEYYYMMTHPQFW